MKKINKTLTIFAVIVTAIFYPLHSLAAGISSSSISLYTLAATPTELIVSESTDTSITFDWEHGENPPITRYTLEQKVSDNWQVVFDKQNTTSYIISDLSGNETYQFRIFSWNEDNLTNGKYASISHLTLPVKPASPLFNLDRQTISLDWSNIVDVNTKVFQNGVLLLETEGLTSTEISDLEPATQYQYYIVYQNTTGDSLPSDLVTVWTDSVTIDNLNVAERTIDSITIGVEDTNPSNGATQYRYRTGSLQSEWITDKTFIFEKLSPGIHEIFVDVRNSPDVNTTNPGKEIGTVSIRSGTQPDQPTITTTPTETTIVVELASANNYIESNEFNITLYKEGGLTYIIDSGWAKTGEGWLADDWTFVFENLIPNTQYIIKGEARYAE